VTDAESDLGPIWNFRENHLYSQQHREPSVGHLNGKTSMSIFDEKYRVVSVEGDRLLVRGVHTGDVLTIINPEPEIPISQDDYPVGKLIALTDPSNKLHN
jgi:hypothetical protein